jgi:protein-S-isoprenylcysteine O-methyltransferase Ste14
MLTMEAVAVVLQAAFLSLAFGLRTFLHWRKTGSVGFRAGARRSKAEAIGGGGLAVAVITSLAATGLFAFGAADRLVFVEIAPLQWVGATLAASGIVLVLAAQTNMGTSWRIGVDPTEETELVTGGLFSFTRNPIFLGMLVFWLGMALIAFGVLSVAAFVLAVVAVEVQIRVVEEPYLHRTHGTAYEAYASRTGRLIPGIGKLHSLRSES